MNDRDPIVPGFTHELGQLFFGNPAGDFALSEIGHAAFFHALSELKRAYWNINQEEWEDHTSGTIGPVTWRRYYWGDDEAEAALPNFEAFGLELRWYKHPGRSMSANRAMTPDEWAAWVERCVKACDPAIMGGTSSAG